MHSNERPTRSKSLVGLAQCLWTYSWGTFDSSAGTVLVPSTTYQFQRFIPLISSATLDGTIGSIKCSCKLGLFHSSGQTVYESSIGHRLAFYGPLSI
ncbi:hypothetical protein BDV26DRAFT_256861 [Aspergillus bertholletiae]|uniref:Uncharacterized protein n=1 Tax=Aspergillus bertholletiae TaxID=1226010 RepID=A0A5N7BFZ6_9EURO|nr:hypothetical protein BDV26DRAFT_256861 [Aspergillus bertholletiae]